MYQTKRTASRALLPLGAKGSRSVGPEDRIFSNGATDLRRRFLGTRLFAGASGSIFLLRGTLQRR